MLGSPPHTARSPASATRGNSRYSIDQLDTSAASNSLGAAALAPASIGGSALPSAAGSKAVLSALRALQDKIRRMESERSDLIEHVSELKSNLETSAVTYQRERTALLSDADSRNKEATAMAGAAVEEKNQLNLQVVRSEEQNKALSRELQHVREGAARAEEEKRVAHTRVTALEKRAESLERDLREAIARGRDAAASAVRARAEAEESAASWKAAEHDMQDRVAQVQAALVAEQERNGRLEQMVRSVMLVNQTMMERLNRKARKATNGGSRRRRKPGLPIPPRTVTTRTRRAAAGGGGGSGGAQRDHSRKRRGSGVTKTRGKGGKTSHQKLVSAYGKEVPWMSGGACEQAPSHSVIATVQSTLQQVKSSPPKRSSSPARHFRDSDAGISALTTGGAGNPGSTTSAGVLGESMQQLESLLQEQMSYAGVSPSAGAGPAPGVSSDTSAVSPVAGAPLPPSPPGRSNTTAGLGSPKGSPAASSILMPRWGGDNGEHSGDATAGPPPPLEVATQLCDAALDDNDEPRPGDEMLGISRKGESRAKDTAVVIEELEQELADANGRYKQLVAEMASPNNAASDAQLAKTMSVLIGEIERKTQQVYLLRKSAQKVKDASERAVVYSPDASRKKAASLRLLSSFRNIAAASGSD